MVEQSFGFSDQFVFRSTMYQVVIFSETNEVEIVPVNWLCTPSQCYWPKIKSYTTLGKWVKNSQSPDPSWMKYPVRKLGSAEASYTIARQKLVRSTQQSDLSEDEESQPRLRQNRNRNKRYNNSDEDVPKNAKRLFNLPPAPSFPAVPVPDIVPPFSVNDLINVGIDHHEIDVALSNEPGQHEEDFQQLEYESDISEYNEEFGVKPQTSAQAANSTPRSSQLPYSNPSSQTVEKQSVLAHHSRNTYLERVNTQIGSNDNGGKLDEILRNVAEIKTSLKVVNAVQRQHSELLNLIIDGGGALPQSNETIDFGLPLDSMNALNDLNEKYKRDAAFKAKLVSYLGSFGGCSLSSATNRLLRELFTDSLATQLAWTGRSSKPGLSTYEFHNVIADAVRLNKKHKDSSKDEIETSIKSWLNHAKERLVRLEKKSSANTHQNSQDNT